MKKTLSVVAAALAITALPHIAHAEDANPLSFNIGVFSEYRFRGISQTRFKPALQGGLDYALPGGFYVGTWLSNIKWIKDAGTVSGVDTGNTQVEWDIYGGYKGEITKELTYDVGVLAYVYPSNKIGDIPGSANANTTEIYGALTYGPATLKYSHSVTTLFGFGNSKNSGYLEAAATFDLGSGFGITPHIGYQRVRARWAVCPTAACSRTPTTRSPAQRISATAWPSRSPLSARARSPFQARMPMPAWTTRTWAVRPPYSA